jgi:hypothetical protein
MMKRRLILTATVVLSACSAAGTPRSRVIPSPAKGSAGAPGARAEVLDWWGESFVRVIARDGAGGEEAVVWGLDGSSVDAEHGYRVVHASWSPSGRYLSVQLDSSGGHQPQYSPLVLFDLDERTETDLQDLLEADDGGASVTRDGGDPDWLPGDRLVFHVLSADGEIRDLVCDPASGEVHAARSGH